MASVSQSFASGSKFGGIDASLMARLKAEIIVEVMEKRGDAICP
jgi:hypothetical protein